MTTNYTLLRTRQLAFPLIIFAIAITSVQTGFSQIRSSVDVPPAEETFVKQDGLMVPWRSGGCILFGKTNHLTSCYTVTSTEFQNNSILSLFNNDGSLWVSFSVQPGRDGYFGTASDSNLAPFSTGTSPTYEGPQFPNIVFLRGTGESTHWFRVVVNENTLLEKYVKKYDARWVWTTWEHWLADGQNLVLSMDHEPLRESPDGKPTPDSAGLRFKRVQFLKSSGDWAFVKGRELDDGELTLPRYGWIKWRDGHRLMVGCIFNNFVPPMLNNLGKSSALVSD